MAGANDYFSYDYTDKFNRADEALKRYKKEQATANLRPALLAAEGKTAEGEAEALSLSKSLNVPAEVASAAPEYARQVQQFNDIANNDILADWAQRGTRNATFARDDTNALLGVLDYLGGLSEKLTKEVVPNVGKQLVHGAADVNSSLVGAVQGVAENTLGTNNVVTQYLDGVQRWINWARPEAVKADSWIGQLGYDFIRSAPQMGSQIGAFVSTGGVGSTAMMAAQIAGGTYKDLRDQGVSPQRALDSAIMNAGMQAPLENLGLDRFLKIFKSQSLKDTAMRILGAAGTEGLTEFVQKYPEFASNIWGMAETAFPEDAEGQLKYFAQQVTDRKNLAEATKEGVYEGLIGAMWGGAGGAVRLLSNQQARARAQNFADALVELKQTVDATKTEQLSPEVMEDFLTSASTTLGQTVTVPAKALLDIYDSGVDISEAFDDTRDMENFREFAEQFPDADIPTTPAALLARLDTEGVTKVAEVLKETPNAPSVVELLSMQEEDKQEEIDAVYADANERAGKRNAFQQEEARLTREMTPHVGAEAAQQYVKLMSAQAKAFEYSYGVSAVDLMRRRSVEFVNAGDESRLDADPNSGFRTIEGVDSFGQAVYHASPYDFDSFSLGHTGEGAGGAAHGWGLYFAQDKSRADYYKRSVGRKHDGKGQVYKVEIPENDVLLDRDALFNEQPEAVKAAVRDAYNSFSPEQQATFYEGMRSRYGDNFADGMAIEDLLNGSLGRDVYLALGDAIDGTDKSASLLLAKHGVKGLVYGNPKRGRSFVVFDDNAVSILEKYYQTETENQRRRAEVEISKDKAIIRLFKGSDLSSIAHESAHIFLDDLLNVASAGDSIVLGNLTNAANKLGSKSEVFENLLKCDLTKENIRSALTEIEQTVEDATKYRNDNKKYITGVRKELKELDIKPVHGENDAYRGHILATQVQEYEDNSRLLASAKAEKKILADALRQIEGRERAFNDVNILCDFAEVPHLEEGLTDEQKVQLQETTAKGFEQYLSEGKAPNKQLEGVFSRFFKWLKGLYASFRDYVGMPLTDNVRQVYDRMLSFEAEAKTNPTLEAAFGQEEDFLLETDISEEDRQELEDQLSVVNATVIDNRQKEYMKAWKRFYKEALAEIRTELEVLDPNGFCAFYHSKFNEKDVAWYFGDKYARKLSFAHPDRIDHWNRQTASLDTECSEFMGRDVDPVEAYQRVIDLWGQYGNWKNMIREKAKELAHKKTEEFLQSQGLYKESDSDSAYTRDSEDNWYSPDNVMWHKYEEWQMPTEENFIAGDDYGAYLEAVDVALSSQGKEGNEKGELIHLREKTKELEAEKADAQKKLVEARGKLEKVSNDYKAAKEELKTAKQEAKASEVAAKKAGGAVNKELKKELTAARNKAKKAQARLNTLAPQLTELGKKFTEIKNLAEKFAKEVDEHRKKYWTLRQLEGDVPTEKSFREMARKEIARTPISKLNFGNYTQILRRSLSARNKAAKLGDFLKASKEMRRARYAFALLQEARLAKKEITRIKSIADKMMKAKPGTYPGVQTEAVRKIAVAMNFIKDKGPIDAIADKKTLKELVDIAIGNADCIDVMPTFDEWVLELQNPDDKLRAQGIPIDWNLLSFEEATQVGNLLSFLLKSGRDQSKNNKASLQAKVDAIVAEAVKNMSGMETYYAGEKNSVKDNLNNAFTSIDTLEWQCRKADGFQNVPGRKDSKEGIMEREILNPLREAMNKYQERLQSTYHAILPHITQLMSSAQEWCKQYGRHGFFIVDEAGKRIDIPDVLKRNGHKGWTSEMVMALAFNLGNAGNRERLRNSFTNPDGTGGISYDTFSLLLGDDAAAVLFELDDKAKADILRKRPRREGILSAKDWKAVQGVWNVFDSQWGDTQRAHAKMYGFAPAGVEATPFTVTIKGQKVKLSGGYYPIKYDRDIDPKAEMWSEKDEIMERSEGIAPVPAARKGHTMARVSHTGRPLDLSVSFINRSLVDSARFIELGNIVRFADKVMQDGTFAAEYTRVYGKDDYRRIRPNLKGIVVDDGTPTGKLYSFAEKVRQHLTFFALAGNLKVAAIQMTAIFPAMGDIGIMPVLKGMAQLCTGGMGLVHNVWEASPFMKRRFQNIDQDLARKATKFRPDAKMQIIKGGKIYTWDDVANIGMMPISIADTIASTGIWLGAYHKKLAELQGKSSGWKLDTESKYHDEAVQYADKTVAASNPDNDALSRSAFGRDKTITRLFNIFTGATVKFAQRTKYMYQGWRKGEISGWELARMEMYDLMFPSVAMVVMLGMAQGLFSGDDDDNESLLKLLVNSTLGQAAMLVPVWGNTMADLISGAIGTAPVRRGGLSSPIDTPIQLAKNFVQGVGEWDPKKLLWSTLDIGSFLTRIPVSPVAKRASKGIEQMEEGEGTPFSIFMPRSGK